MRPARPLAVICLAMILAVALISGLSAIICALVVPVWLFAALIASPPAPRRDDPFRLPAAPVLTAANPRGPPVLRT
jgi:hypothetical protein